MKTHSTKEHIEHKLRRRAGMSADKIEDMHKRAAKESWIARCWNCKQMTAVKPEEIGHCDHCGADLRKRS